MVRTLPGKPVTVSQALHEGLVGHSRRYRACSTVVLCPPALRVNHVPVQPHRVIQSIIKCELRNHWPRIEEIQGMTRMNISAGAFLFSAE